MELLLEEGERGRSAVTALMRVALEKAGRINLALGLVNLPKDEVQS